MIKAAKRLFICLDNGGCEVSLERLKIYVECFPLLFVTRICAVLQAATAS